MVSSIDTVRLWSTQTAIRVFKETDQQQETGQQSLASTILSGYGIDSDEDSSTTYSLADFLATDTSADDTDEASQQTISTDIGSQSFMTGLKERLEELKQAPATRAQAEAMLTALDEGRLTVTDAEGAEAVTAWDATKKDATQNTPSATTQAEWSGFLKQHLQRDGSGKYVRNEDGSYIDKTTGDSAFFGMIGDKYYYLSWTASATDTAAASA
ncbi:hypothetical protein [Rhizobium sp. CSW-27]|uniref:hypothetical protein n=1 Tax=Rhizobium sp. CSW-27 TaxID=2839985 RepID=UPI001C02A7A2|nr:hypothetical protein [Rhizobium sp. CSW-27]MBT9369357.1 hypothetical protein [Rhizobium sp. CSW-27]